MRHWWHVAFALAMVIAALLTVSGPGTRSRRLGGVACVAALSLLYATVGRRMIGDDEFVWMRWAYLAPTIALLLVGLLLSPGFFAVLFIVVPQVYASFPTFRAAVPWAVVVHIAMLVGTARWYDPPFSGAAWSQAALQTAIILVFSLGMGGFITRIIDQSSERATLIAELQSTRAELDLVHREAGIAAERQRLSHEIHDTLAQGFTSVVLRAQTVRALLAEDHPARPHADAIEDTARENLAEARALVADLTPPALVAGSLPAAVGRLTDRLAAEAGLVADVTVTGEPRALGPNEDVALLRAVQEALTNVRRHARARRVDVELDYGPDVVAIRVRDDGHGFDEGAAATGFGLVGMRARLEQVGGAARVHSVPGDGTTVEAWIGPVPA
jgi:signal transduction histidine kinase